MSLPPTKTKPCLPRLSRLGALLLAGHQKGRVIASPHEMISMSCYLTDLQMGENKAILKGDVEMLMRRAFTLVILANGSILASCLSFG